MRPFCALRLMGMLLATVHVQRGMNGITGATLIGFGVALTLPER